MSGPAKEPTPKPLPAPVARIASFFCGCNTTENTWGAVLAELERLDRGDYDRNDGLAAALVDHLELSEHGCSVRGGWLTEDGKAALAWFREYGIDGLCTGGPWLDEEGCYWE